MIVKCVDTKRVDKKGDYFSLTCGKEYVVMAIEFYDKSIATFSVSIGDFTIYRLKDDDGVVMPYPSKLFEISSNKIPSCWVSYKMGDDAFSVLPHDWARDYFWDDFYNDDDIAIREFMQNEKEILSEAYEK